VGDLLGLESILAGWGYRPTKELAQESTSYWSGYFEADEKPRVWVSWSNRFCERVQVGTKTEEVPVYEVRCTS
jgi:hypothetical protein